MSVLDAFPSQLAYIYIYIYFLHILNLSLCETKNMDRFKLIELHFDGGFAGLAFSVSAVI